MKDLKIVFMGTPVFALPALKALLKSEFSLAALVTQPDRLAGRGRKVVYSPVKQWALTNGIELYQPERIGSEEALNWLTAKSPDFVVTAAFGQLLPLEILTLPALGCINVHASYLPYYRGAAPIHRAVIEGASFSGVSIMEMSLKLDAGKVILQEKEPLAPTDTAGLLHDRLAARGALLLVKALRGLASNTLTGFPQDNSLATYAFPLTSADEKLDWTHDAQCIYNRIRGLNPWPGAYTVFEGKRIKVWQAAIPDDQNILTARSEPGTILAVGEQSLTVKAGTGAITLLQLQPEGKKTMGAGSFCCGYRIEKGSRLEGGS